MNILENMSFHNDRPSVCAIKRTDKINYFAIGLIHDQYLKKHTTKDPSLLTVLQGELEFFIHGGVIVLKEFDTYEIPVMVEHEVKGLKTRNIFTIVQEK
ncbi:hypothetical protein LZF95_01605 [Algoriphagus sp. AGSA1]|uniref:hypothetical protein n=1 Tax=Algoriphagus sp. AGSA1 TaxID=2907213 RepID=UPI001F29EB38|nr:hypothetical protein [Algoriphagus sp. AGSA1]MCE7053353.1 hypothetical protein [Algoriphagus sp. AGSA1]